MPPRWPRGRTSRRIGAERRGPLEEDLPAEEHQHARDVEAVREEGAVAGVRLLLRAHPADREDHLVGLAREQVAAARAAVDEQADARSRAAARSRRSRRAPSRRSSSRSPSRPSGRQGCPRSSRAGCRPGSRRSATRDRSPTRPGGASPCGEPATPSSARCRRASRAAARAARARRSRGRRSPARPCGTSSLARRAIRWMTRSV